MPFTTNIRIIYYASSGIMHTFDLNYCICLFSVINHVVKKKRAIANFYTNAIITGFKNMFYKIFI